MKDESRGMITYDGEAGPVQTYLARPGIEGPRPAVIIIHEIVGLTDHIKRVADRFAQEGYVAFAPSLFSRPGLVEVMTPTNVEVAMKFMMTIPRTMARRICASIPRPRMPSLMIRLLCITKPPQGMPGRGC